MDRPSRIVSIDAFRGFAVIGMVLVNYLGGIIWVPAALKHAPDIGLTVADFIAPFFIFAIGLTYGPSFERGVQRNGFGKTVGRFAVRYLAIAGIGAIITAGEPLTGENASWGVLQAIGVAGLICIPFVRLKPFVRLAAGIVLLVAYQAVLDAFMRDVTIASSHGGLYGSVSWAAMLLLCTAFADFFRQSKNKYLLLAVVLLAAGIAVSLLFPVSKHRVSASYVFVTTAAAALLYFAFDLIFKTEKSAGPLRWWGANPLPLYALHSCCSGCSCCPAFPRGTRMRPSGLPRCSLPFCLPR